MIGLWSPSSPCKKEELQRGIARLKELNVAYFENKGFETSCTRPLNKTQGYLAGSEERKIQDLETIWRKPEINSILCSRGGYGALRLLPYLDKSKVIKRSKLQLWGYSDTTILQNYFFKKYEMSWVHSPLLCSSSFHSPNPKESRFWKKMLQQKAASTTTSLKILTLSSKHRGKPAARGHLIGGNFASLISMMGTPWEFHIPRGAWLFLEDVAEAPYKMDRMLTQLSFHKEFKNLAGVVLGHFTHCPQALKIFKVWSEAKDLTLLSKYPAGHEAPNLPLILGERRIFERKNDSQFVVDLPNPFFG
jgi:muramoyltetrapeptide carboxypeptidase